MTPFKNSIRFLIQVLALRNKRVFVFIAQVALFMDRLKRQRQTTILFSAGTELSQSQCMDFTVSPHFCVILYFAASTFVLQFPPVFYWPGLKQRLFFTWHGWLPGENVAKNACQYCSIKIISTKVENHFFMVYILQ